MTVLYFLILGGFCEVFMAQVVTRKEVLSAYRYLLRSITIAFQGDVNTLSAAKKEARSRFGIGKKLSAESPQAWEGLTEARNVSRFLRQNLVQGVKDEKKDVYRMNPQWRCIYDQGYGYMMRLSVEIIQRLRTHLQCHYRNGNLDGKGQICHDTCIKSNRMSN